MEPKLRRLCAGDLDRICEMEALCFHTPWSRQAFVDELHNPLAHYIVVLEPGSDRPVGYAGCWYIVDEGHITNIAVHPDFRGRGFGRALLGALVADAERQGIAALTLEVREKNDVAQRLYASFGFVKLGERKGYYADTGENAWIMWRRGSLGGEAL